MTDQIAVVVVQGFTHEGRALTAGETLRVPPVVAAVLHRRGVVSLSRIITRAVVAEEAEAKPARTRRTYRRRDLAAEV